MKIFVQDQAPGPEGLHTGGTCENNNHPSTICRTSKARRHILDIQRIIF